VSASAATAVPRVAPLLADDPAVPTRDLLLDADAVAAHVAPAIVGGAGGTIDACACERAKYRIGHSLRTVYRLRVDGNDHWLAARTLYGERAERAVRLGLQNASPAAPLRPVAHVPALGAVFYAFPNDRKIAGLRVLGGGPALERAIGIRARTEVVAWAPEDAATARCLAADGSVIGYAKAYTGDRARATDAIHTTLLRATAGHDERAPQLPRILARSYADDAIVFEPMAGPTLLDLRGDARADALERLGTALAVLHTLPVPAGAPMFERLSAERLATAAEVVGRARPDLAAQARDLAADLAAAAHGVRAQPPVCLHGDAHPANAIAARSRIALIDLDDVSLGAAASDLARVFAGLLAQRLTDGLPAAEERRLGERLLAGYAGVRAPADEGDLAWHTAATLLARHAQPAVGRVRPAALIALPEILAAARELIAR
jgi:phosphotransferase family enzyme